MERAKVLRKLIENTGLNIKAFAEKANVPYTTLFSILERGVSKASVDNVIRICRTLGITIEGLENMANSNLNIINEEPQTITANFDGDQFTEEEMKEIMEYARFIQSKRK
jgi:hypothetical protein